VFAAFGPDKDMQLYDRGIRRRLAPMLGGDRRRLELAYSLMFTLPGTPVLRYGDEIGMGDDLSLPERNCARTPMQWSTEPHGGFTKSAQAGAPGDQRRRLRLRACQCRQSFMNSARDPRNSMLNWMERTDPHAQGECPKSAGATSCMLLEPTAFRVGGLGYLLQRRDLACWRGCATTGATTRVLGAAPLVPHNLKAGPRQ
jgi:hypothetical protein